MKRSLASICINCNKFLGKNINRVACGSAHTLAWSTMKPASTGKLPARTPMEYDRLHEIAMDVLRNRLVLLHNFSDLLCPSIAMFKLCTPSTSSVPSTWINSNHDNQPVLADDISRLRALLVSSVKVHF